MLNKATVMQLASRFLGSDKMQSFSKAFDIANQITDMTSDPAEAMRKAGVTEQDLQKVRSLVNNPMSSLILGDKRNSIISGLDKAESYLNPEQIINSPVEQAPASELEQMQAELARLK